MSQREQLSFAFWCGWLSFVGLSMAYQDAIGLERYINAARAGWVDLPWWVGALLAAFALVSYALAWRKGGALMTLKQTEHTKRWHAICDCDDCRTFNGQPLPPDYAKAVR